jgi:hypothetical protein
LGEVRFAAEWNRLGNDLVENSGRFRGIFQPDFEADAADKLRHLPFQTDEVLVAQEGMDADRLEG